MKFIFTGKNLQITDDMRDIVEKKLSKLDKFFEKEETCNITISEFKNDFIVEASISLPSGYVRAEEQADSVQTAVDKVSDKITRQIRKNKTKLQNRNKPSSFNFDEIPEYTEEEIKEDIVSDEVESDNEIVKEKTYTLGPMTEQDAILQAELIGHDFFVFNNSETDQINVVYKRNRGGYGILVPEQDKI